MLPVLTYGLGVLTRNRAVAAAGLHTGEAVVGAEIVTEILKVTLGRARPYVSHDREAGTLRSGAGCARGTRTVRSPQGTPRPRSRWRLRSRGRGRARWARCQPGDRAGWGSGWRRWSRPHASITTRIGRATWSRAPGLGRWSGPWLRDTPARTRGRSSSGGCCRGRRGAERRPWWFTGWRSDRAHGREGPTAPRAGDGTRTRDHKLGRLVLYQLSYSRERMRVFNARADATGTAPERVGSGGGRIRTFEGIHRQIYSLLSLAT